MVKHNICEKIENKIIQAYFYNKSLFLLLHFVLYFHFDVGEDTRKSRHTYKEYVP